VSNIQNPSSDHHIGGWSGNYIYAFVSETVRHIAR